jgi:hypothetical protein
MCHDLIPTPCQALESNEFDIVGLADLPEDEHFLARCLRDIAVWLLSRRAKLATRDELAQVLYALVRVAQEEYGEGHGYWPHLEKRIAAARACEHFQMTQVRQSLLGSWFRQGLTTFHYSSPRDGQVNVGPILRHAGCPRQQLPRLLDFVVACMKRYGEAALDADALLDLQLGEDASSWAPPLPRAVVRLLHENPAGAGELWRRLATVAQAWHEGGEEAVREAWEELPGIAMSDLLKALARQAQPASFAEKLPLRPRLRYDCRTGEVRLWLAEGRPEDWDMPELALRWEGDSAQLLKPPGPAFTICHRPTERRWQETAWVHDRPVLFFSCPAGALERGNVIAGRGLEAGPWYVLLCGQPAGLTAEQRCPLAWSSLQGGEGWTAWQVEVPPRGAERSWTLTLDGQRVELLLARRSGPRLRISEAVLTAQTSEGQPAEVFGGPPTVCAGDRGLSVRLLRRWKRSAKLVETLLLAPETPVALPVPKPGVYQLRAAGGSGKILLDFAVLPGLKIQGPEIEGEQACLEMATNSELGHLHGNRVEPRASGHWRIRQLTTEPWLSAEWQWSDADDPPLRLSWPVQDLRWRLLNLGDGLEVWTRETRIVEGRRLAPAKALLQVQVPNSRSLGVNGVVLGEDRRQQDLTGDTFDIDLLGYTRDESVRLQVGEVEYWALVLSERPLLDNLDARQQDGRLCLTWAANHLPADTFVMAWDPCNPASEPDTWQLDESNRSSHSWQSPNDWPHFGPQRAVSVTLGVKLRAGFGIAAARPQPALDEKGHPFTRLVLPAGLEKTEEAWLELVHRWGDRLRWGGQPPGGPSVRGELSTGPFPVRMVCIFLKGLEKVRPPGQSVEWDRVRAELEEILADRAVPHALGELQQTDEPTAQVVEWLGWGIHLGWRSQADYQGVRASVEGYPLAYFRDLWLLNSGEPKERRREAAESIWALHNELGLFSPSAGLPLLRAQARGKLWFAALSDKGHEHRLRPPFPADDDNESFFCRQVAVEECYLEKLKALPEDEFPMTPRPPTPLRIPGRRRMRRTGAACNQPTKYELAHMPHEAGWELVRDEWKQACQRMVQRRCCRATGPLLTEAWDGAKLLQHLEVRRWLLKESSHVTSPAGSRLPEAWHAVLEQDEKLGAALREFLQPPPIKPSVLFDKSVGERPAFEDVPEAGKAAWALAWLDRLAAREVPARTALSRAFLQALRAALLPGGAWGRLLKGCLVIAEYALTILREGGLGAAFRFVR